MNAIRWGIIATLVAGCAGSISTPPASVRPDRGRASIAVVNNNVQVVRVYVELGSTAYPLGSVDAFDRRTFVLPKGMSTSVVRLRIQPFGARQAFTTPDLTLETDRMFELRVASQLTISYVQIR